MMIMVMMVMIMKMVMMMHDDDDARDDAFLDDDDDYDNFAQRMSQDFSQHAEYFRQWYRQRSKGSSSCVFTGK